MFIKDSCALFNTLARGPRRVPQLAITTFGIRWQGYAPLTALLVLGW
jgi:hypothetical protein